ncbi:MAG: hypothetical protein FWG65_12795 [Turicibacter sp.]|nr:hypothetical protein [Turicibacter sp.]
MQEQDKQIDQTNPKTDLKNTNKEIDTADYARDRFTCECPRCGFLYNV